jgi:hypothetical protein
MSEITLGLNRYRIRYNDANPGGNFLGDIDAGNTAFVTLTVVPEASTFIIIGLGGVFVIAAVRMGKRLGFAPLEILS